METLKCTPLGYVYVHVFGHYYSNQLSSFHAHFWTLPDGEVVMSTSPEQPSPYSLEAFGRSVEKCLETTLEEYGFYAGTCGAYVGPLQAPIHGPLEVTVDSDGTRTIVKKGKGVDAGS